MVAGYIISSRNDSALALQLRKRLSNFAYSNGDYISLWMFGATGRTDSMNGCIALMDKMSRGDAVYVDDVTTLGASFKDILSFLSEAVKRGIRVYGCSDGYTNHEVRDRESYLQALGQIDRAYSLMLSNRTKAALRSRKDDGVKLGRPLGSCVSMRALVQDAAFIRAALENGERISALCSRYNVSRSTFTRFMLKTGLRRRKSGQDMDVCSEHNSRININQ